MSEWIVYVSAAIAVFCATALVFGAFYYVRRIRRLEDILSRFWEMGTAEFDTMKETRESKLENRLMQLLSRAAAEREKLSGERDDVAALLSDLSHQLKTPLANIVVYTEFLQENDLDKENCKRFAREAGVQAQKMQWLMEAMLKASRLEQGIISFKAGFCPVKETIAMAVSSVYAKADKKQIQIVTEEFEDRRLYHNPKWTAEALGNILDNAVKYSPEKAVITVRLYPMEIYTRIEIWDMGCGIDSGEFNQIFRRFYRGEEVQRQEGNGLGLYLAQLILNREKGYITVSSQKGEGSCFYVHLLNEDTWYEDTWNQDT